MRTILGVCLLAGLAQAAIQNVSIEGVTATQAILKYQAPDPTACTVGVSESPTLLPLVNAVDPARFASASSDARPGSAQNRAEHVFVVGKRAAELGLDGVRYSRALQTVTPHYYRITCGNDQATGAF